MKRRKFIAALGVTAVASTGILGISWLKILSTESLTIAKFCNKIGVIAKKSVKIDSLDLLQSKEAIKSIIEAEYATGKTIYINSWLYSETEAKIAGYRHQSSSC
ncbi:MAG: hypothetical protein QNL04_07605 [SAR324 cluster bacterium]|nr:hypothetical protein [SAR324 cluster bacterium]